jgi:HK97 family phage portal protein
MGVSAWLSRFGKKDSYNLLEMFADNNAYDLAIQDFAMQMAINLIAGIVAKCEIKTINEGQLVKDREYYLLNYEPNQNQSASDFFMELISKLLYYNEALVVEQAGQLLIADNFTRREFALYPNRYENVSRGSFTFSRTFYEPDVLYFRYANSNIKGMLDQLLSGYSTMITSASDKFKRAGGRKGVVNLDKIATGNEERKKELDEIFNNRFKSFYNAENAVISLPNGVDYRELASITTGATDASAIINLTKESFMRTAQAFKIPGSLLMGDVANLDSALDEMLTVCICPLCDTIETELIRKRIGSTAFRKGTTVKMDTTAIKHFDLLEMASGADKLIASSLYNVDEIREKLGDTPLNTWWSKEYYITKNYEQVGGVSEEEGGEDEQ